MRVVLQICVRVSVFLGCGVQSVTVHRKCGSMKVCMYWMCGIETVYRKCGVNNVCVYH